MQLDVEVIDFPKIKVSLCGFESHSCYQDGGIGIRTRLRIWQKRDVAVVGSIPIRPTRSYRKLWACSSAVRALHFFDVREYVKFPPPSRSSFKTDQQTVNLY